MSGSPRRSAPWAIIAALVAAAVFTGATSAASDAGSPGEEIVPESIDAAQSVELAYEFLDARVDEFCDSADRCLPRSYQGGFFTTPSWDFTPSFVYDDALVVIAYTARGLPEDLRRAQTIGDTLLFVQDEDPIGDGRVRTSYEPHGIRQGRVEITGPGTFTGNQAWVGMALTRLFHATGEQKYLDGALRIGEWVQTNTADMVRAPYGYTGGQTDDGTSLVWKSTEHNSDLAGFFTQLAQATGDSVWADRASVAAGFVAAMQSADGHVDTGTLLDGSTVNTHPIPLDAQTWSSLATGDARYGAALDWTLANLIATDGPYTGPSISNVDVSKAWFEGGGHLALALELRDAPGDADRVDDLLGSIRQAQLDAPNGDGKGIVATSNDGLDSGFGDLYYASLHTGTTAWYLLAAAGDNPFRLPVD
ncbi:glycoside hydrolase family 76 protein [Microbacterium sp. EST19A]|uniref:glycoside hydrolase family 76 protein n=1 Tax=Microbacterium sp. EST19A TaxID=2862681 RepID=UPI001CBB4673|nr:glycoside hydrolase family 76 protein [Microbacterium sp. EST19A]